MSPLAVCPVLGKHAPRYTDKRVGLLTVLPGFQRGDLFAECVGCETSIERAHAKSSAWNTMTRNPNQDTER